MKAPVRSPQGRQVPKGRVLWEQQAGGGVRQVTALKEILDLGTQGQAWGERGPLRPRPGGGPRLMRQNGEGWREERKERHMGPPGGAREAWSRKAGGARQVGGPGLGRPPTAGQAHWMGVRRGLRQRNEQPWQKVLGREVSSSRSRTVPHEQGTSAAPAPGAGFQAAALPCHCLPWEHPHRPGHLPTWGGVGVRNPRGQGHNDRCVWQAGW